MSTSSIWATSMCMISQSLLQDCSDGLVVTVISSDPIAQRATSRDRRLSKEQRVGNSGWYEPIKTYGPLQELHDRAI